MNMRRQKERLVEGTEWSVTHMGSFICPCGTVIEDDGQCPEGHESPLKQLGMI